MFALKNNANGKTDSCISTTQLRYRRLLEALTPPFDLLIASISLFW